MEANKNKIKSSMSVFKLYKITLRIENFKIGILKKKMRGQIVPNRPEYYIGTCSKDTQ